MELENMDIKTQSRWMAMLLAIDHIDEYCHYKNRCFDLEILKPIPIKHFIEEKSKVIEQKLIIDQQNKFDKKMALDVVNQLELMVT